MGAHVVDKAVNILVVTIIILDRHFKKVESGLVPVDIDGVRKEDILILIQVDDKGRLAARYA